MIEGTSVADQRQLKQSQIYDGRRSSELWKDSSASGLNSTDVVEEHKNKTDILEVLSYYFTM